MDSVLSHPTVHMIYMILISAGMINYGFMAFQRNPLEKLASMTGFKMIIFGLLGLIGLHYMLQQFGLLDDVAGYASQGYQKGREILELDEGFRHRRQMGMDRQVINVMRKHNQKEDAVIQEMKALQQKQQIPIVSLLQKK